MIERVKLGKTEIEIPRLGIGGWQAAGWQRSDDAAFKSIIKTALDLNLNFFDTAEAYGKGHSEKLLGEALKGIRQRCIIATKFSHRYKTAAQIRKVCEDSLRTLKTDYIDLYQYHWPAPKIDLNEVISVLEALRKEGKVRAIGVSNWMEPEWEELQDHSRVDSLQPCYNLLWRSIEEVVLPLCIEKKIAVLPYSPLAQGILAGKFSKVDELPNDPRKQNVLLTPARFEMVTPVLEVMRSLASKYGKPLGQIALRWLLQQRGVTAPIVGATSKEQLMENALAFTWALTDGDIQLLSEVSAPISADLKPHDTLWGWHPKSR